MKRPYWYTKEHPEYGTVYYLKKCDSDSRLVFNRNKSYKAYCGWDPDRHRFYCGRSECPAIKGTWAYNLYRGKYA